MIRKPGSASLYPYRYLEEIKVVEERSLLCHESKDAMPTGILMARQDVNWKGLSNSSKGFTLIEVLLVIAIIGILSAISVPVYNSYLEKARASAAVLAIGVIQRTIAAYYMETNNYPSSLADIGMGSMRDPWGNPYQYLKIAGVSNGTGGNGGGSGVSNGSESGGAGGKGGNNTAKGNGTETAGNSGGNSGGGNSGKARKDRFLVPINSDYDLYSMGPDGRSVAPLTAQASRDDIIRANDGAFIGRASDF